MKLFNTQLELIEEEMQELTSTNEVLERKIGFMMSNPNISFISAATVVGETLGFESIVNAKQLASYAGYKMLY